VPGRLTCELSPQRQLNGQSTIFTAKFTKRTPCLTSTTVHLTNPPIEYYTPNKKYFIISVIAAIIVSAIISLTLTFMALFALISIGYFIVNPIRIYISLRGFRGARAPTKITKEEMLCTKNSDLPVYTILIPVFHESKILAQNLRNMYNLNYPKNKLDIKILMEEKDKETINKAKLLGLFGSPKKMVKGIPREEYTDFLKLFDPIIVPSAKITIKPRACNYGLIRAKGELIVIYDAEDKPDPDQLRKAAIVFLRSSKDIICLQSKLTIYNADENVLTKWYSIEYANWFEFYLQGLDWVEAPIPLGGTSNHFRKKSLDELGRWDPYNVTEDADIGIRLARQKMKTEMINSYTYEEAPVEVKSWIRQRSRWYKGHLQTHLVHMRHPGGTLQGFGCGRIPKVTANFRG
jgi:cellulose synthase/poly-beta-1,6-N-acetylglucosamine synthase-like glycosyltransferase